MFTLRAHARKQAVLYSLMSIVLLPVAFLLFVVPTLPSLAVGALEVVVIHRPVPDARGDSRVRRRPEFCNTCVGISLRSAVVAVLVRPTGPQEAARSDLR